MTESVPLLPANMDEGTKRRLYVSSSRVYSPAGLLGVATFGAVVIAAVVLVVLQLRVYYLDVFDSWDNSHTSYTPAPSVSYPGYPPTYAPTCTYAPTTGTSADTAANNPKRLPL